MNNIKSNWEVEYNAESGEYYIQRLVYMSLPDSFDKEFETSDEAQEMADTLNWQDSVKSPLLKIIDFKRKNRKVKK